MKGDIGKAVGISVTGRIFFSLPMTLIRTNAITP